MPATHQRPLLRYRLINAIVLGSAIALGLGTKVYDGWGQTWVNDYSGDIVYDFFWIWLIGFFQPRRSASFIALGVFLVTASIEFSQLIPFPTSWKTNLVWRLFLGVSFSPWDFLHYALGCFIGGWSLHNLQSKTGLSPSTGSQTSAIQTLNESKHLP